MPLIAALRRLRQEDCHVLPAKLHYIVSPRAFLNYRGRPDRVTGSKREKKKEERKERQASKIAQQV